MTRIVFPYQAEDLSAVARSLSRQLAEAEAPPSHLTLMNMLARAAGYRNFQHFRAQAVARQALEQPVPPPPAPVEVDYARIRRLLRCFDAEKRLLRWPPKDSERRLCLWVLWARVPSRAVMAEKAFNAVLNEHHLFGDHALLRRLLCDYGLVHRTRDGREYQRIEQPPPAEALALLAALR